VGKRIERATPFMAATIGMTAAQNDHQDIAVIAFGKADDNARHRHLSYEFISTTMSPIVRTIRTDPEHARDLLQEFIDYSGYVPHRKA
jgi:hypothetical protein